MAWCFIKHKYKFIFTLTGRLTIMYALWRCCSALNGESSSRSDTLMWCHEEIPS